MPSSTIPMSGFSCPQRAPLHPRDTADLSNRIIMAESSPVLSTPISSPHCTEFCKRHNSEPLANRSENEPLTIRPKRQRTKSSDIPVVDETSFCNVNTLSASDCLSFKSVENGALSECNERTLELDDSSFLCDENVNTCHVNPENKRTDIVNNSSIEVECGCDNKLDASSPRVSCDANSVEGDVYSCKNGLNGALSPYCDSSLDYAAQLPEGCSGSAAQSLLPEGSYESDEREDDDNYLDSSEHEDDDEADNTNNDEDESCGEDDQSVVSSITVGSTCSLRSAASEAMNTICINEHGLAANEDGSLVYDGMPSSLPLSSFSVSLFSNVPPALNFCQYNECIQELPLTISKLLKWKFSTITPLVVKKTITASGFKIVKKSSQWCGTWGKHMKSTCFKAIKNFQKVNHFPGSFQIGRKDKLWKNFARLQARFGRDEFGFIPKTFILPGDLHNFKAAFDKEGVKKKWIVKPPASARGTGIQVIHKWSQMPAQGSFVVQRYISRPYLINDTKFDIRIYVLIASFHPLRIYLYQDGLVRFASVQYNKASKTLSDRYMHLTNYSVNKTSSSYTHNEDAGQCQGHKWTLRSLWGYLKVKGIDTGALWSRIADMVIKAVISGENDIIVRTRRNAKSRYSCYELFGFDVILDEKLRPWLLEVNISPSLHSASPLDHSVKGPLIADILNLVSFHVPDKLTHSQQVELLEELSLGEKVSSLCLDRRLYTKLLTAEEQLKHSKINAHQRCQYLESVLENLTPDDVRHLLIAEDELNRAGTLTCIFPTADTHQYFGFMDRPRYYNRLFDAWENYQSGGRQKGIDRLEGLCRQKYHLLVPLKFKLPKVSLCEDRKALPSRLPSHRPQTSSKAALESSGRAHHAACPRWRRRPASRRVLKVAANPLRKEMLKHCVAVRSVTVGEESCDCDACEDAAWVQEEEEEER